MSNRANRFVTSGIRPELAGNITQVVCDSPLLCELADSGYVLAMPEPLRIWCNASFPPAATRLLEEGLAGYELTYASTLTDLNLKSGPADPQLAEADVAVGQPPPEGLLASRRLRWVHLTSAGYERYDRPEFLEELKRRGVALTSSSDVYDEPCAEQLLAMILSLGRRLPDALENQRGSHGWPNMEIRGAARLLVGQTALLLGLGAIARRLVDLLAPFRMRLIAIRRRVRGDEPVPTHSQADVDQWLPQADHVINMLPGGTATEKFLNAQRIARMKRTALVYNIGRGSTVDEAALVAALCEGRIAGAYLDVTAAEPLPPEHALWTTPNCYITPHSAGGHVNEFERLVRHFLNSLELFVGGRELRNRVV